MLLHLAGSLREVATERWASVRRKKSQGKKKEGTLDGLALAKELAQADEKCDWSRVINLCDGALKSGLADNNNKLCGNLLFLRCKARFKLAQYETCIANMDLLIKHERACGRMTGKILAQGFVYKAVSVLEIAKRRPDRSRWDNDMFLAYQCLVDAKRSDAKACAEMESKFSKQYNEIMIANKEQTIMPELPHLPGSLIPTSFSARPSSSISPASAVQADWLPEDDMSCQFKADLLLLLIMTKADRLHTNPDSTTEQLAKIVRHVNTIREYAKALKCVEVKFKKSSFKQHWIEDSSLWEVQLENARTLNQLALLLRVLRESIDLQLYSADVLCDRTLETANQLRSIGSGGDLRMRQRGTGLACASSLACLSTRCPALCGFIGPRRPFARRYACCAGARICSN